MERWKLFKVTDITYAVDEEDLEDMDVTVEEVVADLPTSLDIWATDESDLADKISDITGWLVEKFNVTK